MFCLFFSENSLNISDFYRFKLLFSVKTARFAPNWEMTAVDENCRKVYDSTMFNTQHILYMLISGLLTVALLILVRCFVKEEKGKDRILRFFAIITVVIHYSNLWVDYFVSGGNATIENNHILPVYPCNVVMWMLLAAALMKDKKRMIFRLLSEFCFYGGIVCGIVGIVLNANFDNTPTLADYDVLKGMLSHSTMLFGCIYMMVGGYIRVRVFNAVSVTAGLGTFVICGLGVNLLYTLCGMEPPDGMFLLSNPYIPVSPIILGIGVILLMFIVLALYELRLPEEERWYRKMRKKESL